MNGVHDMGGMDGFGPVQAEAGEPVFHAPWEGRVMAMSRAVGAAGFFAIDEMRDGIERLPPHVYLASSYYEKWFLRLEKVLAERGIVGSDELAAGRSLRPGAEPPRGPFRRDALPRAMKRGRFERPSEAPPRFQVGERVRARNIHPASHTRLPRYVRGRAGVVERVLGHQVFPDAVVARGAEEPQWLYVVTFEAAELWGEGADPTLQVSVDAWESYLEAL